MRTTSKYRDFKWKTLTLLLQICIDEKKKLRINTQTVDKNVSRAENTQISISTKWNIFNVISLSQFCKNKKWIYYFSRNNHDLTLRLCNLFAQFNCIDFDKANSTSALVEIETSRTNLEKYYVKNKMITLKWLYVQQMLFKTRQNIRFLFFLTIFI